ncbi:retinal G protein coupled receptor b [Colossoma macropomum]|uniref:retinal G protein coupled receptor b n=1 Tax=Colossoma macropomum TaxID=42526 RepID=UPI00186458B9|nr:retinal G protein coupled receptor b [Colossoma macropomum]
MASYTLPEGFDDFDMFAFGSVLLVGAVLGFFLNFVSVMAYLRVKELRTPSNFFVFNLALADLSLNCNGLASAYASYLRYWPFGPEGCQIHGVQGMVSILAGISFLGAVAWDRYHMYCTKQKMFWSTSLTISTILWALAIFWAALPLPSIGWGVFDFEPMKVGCTLDYTRGDRDYITYMLSITLLYLVFPLFIMYSSYNAIYAYFKKTHNFKFNTGLPVKTLLLCWGPYVVMCIYACFENTKLVSPKIRMVLPVLAKLSPIFHALLYAYGNEFYRGGIWQFLTGQTQADKRK